MKVRPSRMAETSGKNNPRAKHASQPVAKAGNPRHSRPVGASNNPRHSQPVAKSNNPRHSQPVAGKQLPAQGIASGVTPLVPPAGDPNPYSRGAAGDDYSKDRRRKKRKRVFLGVFIAVLACILGATGAAWAYISGIEHKMSEDITPEVVEALEAPAEYEGGAFYMLLIGADKSQSRSESELYEGDSFRSDSMMLARVDPQNKKITLISMERDIQVDLEENGIQKLNAAYSIGGPAYAIKTISKLAGVPISHYAEVDFDGFRAAVDAVGGVEVDVPIDIDDPEAGGQLSKGLQTLNGDQALILCRSRHAYDEYGAGDYYRAANQRAILGAIAKKVLSSDVATIAGTVEAMASYITTDFSVMDIVSLANTMRGLDPSTDIYSAMSPGEGVYDGETWYEILDEEEWESMMARVRQGLPPTEDDVIDEYTGIVMASAGDGGASGRSDAAVGANEVKKTFSERRTGIVSIKNGNGTAGVGAEALDRIAPLGYTADAGNANSFDYAETVVVFDSDDQRVYAEELVEALGCGRAIQNNGEYLYEGDFLILIGSDWQ